jgi:hypothetical protein
MSHVHVYYAKNSYLECQHACQTLIDWHRAGIQWEDMAIAVCEQNTLPSLLPLTLSASGIPVNAKQYQPILMSGYAQYFLSLLQVHRLNFCQNDMLRMLKTGFTPLSDTEVMDMENYVRKNGIQLERQEFRRRLLNARNAERVLCRKSRNGAHGKYAVHRHRLNVGLNARSAAGIASRYGQCGLHRQMLSCRADDIDAFSRADHNLFLSNKKQPQQGCFSLHLIISGVPTLA